MSRPTNHEAVTYANNLLKNITIVSVSKNIEDPGLTTVYFKDSDGELWDMSCWYTDNNKVYGEW